MASSISQTQLNHALTRYPAVLKGLSRPPKEGHLTLEDLDKFRYTTAPMNFSKSTGRLMELSDLKKLIEWKMRHGTFRPTLGKLVAKNSNEKIAAALKDGFAHYSSNKGDISGTLDRITKPLSGIGPAAGSLILSIHDPQNIVFFSDELYSWLCADGAKASPKYTVKEFEELFSKAKAFMSKMKCTPIELEQAAFVLIKENEPVYEPKPKKEPSGLPRGRPAKPESEKKPKKVPSGLPRGRPAKPDSEKKVAAGKKARATTNGVAATSNGEPKKRGQPSKAADEEEASTPVSKKRKGAPTSAGSSSKKAKD